MADSEQGRYRSGSGKSVLIRPSPRFFTLNFKEIWDYRELFLFLVWRDIKVRYKQTFLGAFWAIIQPFLLMVVFSIFLGRIAGISSSGVPYPLFAFSGLVPWAFFSQALNGASQSVVSSGTLVSKIYFPRIITPVASAASYLLDLVIAMTVLAMMMLYYGAAPSAAVIWLPLLVAFTLMTALAVGIGLAALNVRYRDVKYAVPFLLQLWLFITPAAYSLELFPERWRVLAGLNPMAGVVEGFRWALLQNYPAPNRLIFLSVIVAMVLLVVGVLYFQRMERTFADVI